MTKIHIAIKSSVLDTLDLLASASKQLEYEKKVPHVSIPAELIEIYATEIFHPKNLDFRIGLSSKLSTPSRGRWVVC